MGKFISNLNYSASCCFLLFFCFLCNNLDAQSAIKATDLSISIQTQGKQVIKSSRATDYSILIKNTGDKTYSNLQLKGEVAKWINGEILNQLDFNQAELIDPNSNYRLEPQETWTVKFYQSLSYETTESFVLKVGVSAQIKTKTYVAADATMLHGIGTNISISTNVTSVDPGDVVPVDLISRLLINEDAAKDPGVTSINVGGIDLILDLPKSIWEARDALISASTLNNGNLFDPFNPALGIPLNNFCIAGADGGRNTNNILDECESIDSFREPCLNFGEDDVTCEFPDWQFCYDLVIPADYALPTYTIMAADSFNIWMASESPPGSGNYNDFTDVTSSTGGYVEDEFSIDVNVTNCNVPPLLDEAVNLTGTSTRLYWLPVSGADKYRIQYRAVGDANWILKSNTTLNTTLTNLTPVTDYEFRFASRCGTWGSYGEIYNFTSSGCMPPDTDYTESLYGAVEKVVLLAVPDASKYQVRYRPTSGGGWKIKNITGGSVSRNLTNLLADTEYEFEKRTQCNSGTYTPFSELDYFTTSSCVPPAPVNVSFPGDGDVLVEWESQENAEKYQIRYRPAGNPIWTVKASNTPMKVLLDLLPNQNYLYQMRAKCPSWTAWSSNNSFSTPSFTEASISVNRSSDSMFEIYPNPVSNGQLFVSLDEQTIEDATLTIYDMKGQQVSQPIKILDVNQAVNVNQLVVGQYFAKLKSSNASFTTRFMITK